MTPDPVDPALADALAELRAYRMPEPVSWWPPAPGWWVVFAILLGPAGWLAWRAWRRHRQTAAARAARRALNALRGDYARTGDAAAFCRELSALLRRYAIARWPRQQVAGLTGADWLDFLDRHGGDGMFASGPGRQLLDAPYRPGPDLQVTAVADVVERWLARNPGPGR